MACLRLRFLPVGFRLQPHVARELWQVAGTATPFRRAPRTQEIIESNPLAAPEKFPAKFADFQAPSNWLVERIYRAVKKRRPEALVSAAVFATMRSYTRRFRMWRRWLQMGILDDCVSDGIHTDTAVFQKQIEVASH